MGQCLSAADRQGGRPKDVQHGKRSTLQPLHLQSTIQQTPAFEAWEGWLCCSPDSTKGPFIQLPDGSRLLLVHKGSWITPEELADVLVFEPIVRFTIGELAKTLTNPRAELRSLSVGLPPVPATPSRLPLLSQPSILSLQVVRTPHALAAICSAPYAIHLRHDAVPSSARGGLPTGTSLAMAQQVAAEYAAVDGHAHHIQNMQLQSQQQQQLAAVTGLLGAAVQRAHLLMSEVPVLLTLLAPSGIVLSQNEASVLYFGQLEGLDVTGRAAVDGTLLTTGSSQRGPSQVVEGTAAALPQLQPDPSVPHSPSADMLHGSQLGLGGLFDSSIFRPVGSSQPVVLPPDLQNNSAILMESLHDTDGGPSPMRVHMQQHRGDGEGDLLPVGGRLAYPGGLLACLFMFATPGALEEMLEEVLIKGVAWRCVIRVPVNLQHAAAAVARASVQEEDEVQQEGAGTTLKVAARDSNTPLPAAASHDSTLERSSHDGTTAILSTIPDRTSLMSPKVASPLAKARVSDTPSLEPRSSRTSGPSSKHTTAAAAQPLDSFAVTGSTHQLPPAASLRRISLSATARGSEPGVAERPSGFRKVPSAGALALMDPTQGPVTALAAAAQAAAGLMVQAQAAASREGAGGGTRLSLTQSIDSNRSSFNKETTKDMLTTLLGRQSFTITGGGAQAEGGARNQDLSRQLKSLSSMPRPHGTSLAGAPPRPPHRHFDAGPGSAGGVLPQSPRYSSLSFNTGARRRSGTSPQVPSPKLGLGSQEDTQQQQGQQQASPPTKPGIATPTDAQSQPGTGGGPPSGAKQSHDGREAPPRRVLSWQDADAEDLGSNVSPPASDLHASKGQHKGVATQAGEAAQPAHGSPTQSIDIVVRSRLSATEQSVATPEHHATLTIPAVAAKEAARLMSRNEGRSMSGGGTQPAIPTSAAQPQHARQAGAGNLLPTILARKSMKAALTLEGTLASHATSGQAADRLHMSVASASPAGKPEAAVSHNTPTVNGGVLGLTKLVVGDVTGTDTPEELTPGAAAPAAAAGKSSWDAGNHNRLGPHGSETVSYSTSNVVEASSRQGSFVKEQGVKNKRRHRASTTYLSVSFAGSSAGSGSQGTGMGPHISQHGPQILTPGMGTEHPRLHALLMQAGMSSSFTSPAGHNSAAAGALMGASAAGASAGSGGASAVSPVGSMRPPQRDGSGASGRLHLPSVGPEMWADDPGFPLRAERNTGSFVGDVDTTTPGKVSKGLHVEFDLQSGPSLTNSRRTRFTDVGVGTDSSEIGSDRPSYASLNTGSATMGGATSFKRRQMQMRSMPPFAGGDDSQRPCNDASQDGARSLNHTSGTLADITNPAPGTRSIFGIGGSSRGRLSVASSALLDVGGASLGRSGRSAGTQQEDRSSGRETPARQMTGPNVPTVQPSTAALTDATEHAHTAEHSGRTAQQQHPEAELEQSAPGNPSPAELQQAQQLKQELEQEPEKGVMQVADPAAGEPEAEMTCAWHELEVKPVIDPITKEVALLLVQRDVTERAHLETTLSELTEAQLTMLSQIFPRHVIEALSLGGRITMDKIAMLARSHRDVTILFMDIVGFTAMSKDVPAEDVLIFLNLLFSRFDMLVERHGVQKIDTIGDAYLVSAGMLAPDGEGFKSVDEDHDPQQCALRVVCFAMDMLRAAMPVRMPNGELVRLRIGIHTGPCVTGLVGLGVPKWTCLGDTVNTAARLEQTCEMCHIQISEDTYRLLPPELYGFRPSGGVEMKGKGRMQTWLWAPPEDWFRAAEAGQTPTSAITIAPTDMGLSTQERYTHLGFATMPSTIMEGSEHASASLFSNVVATHQQQHLNGRASAGGTQGGNEDEEEEEEGFLSPRAMRAWLRTTTTSSEAGRLASSPSTAKSAGSAAAASLRDKPLSTQREVLEEGNREEAAVTSKSKRTSDAGSGVQKQLAAAGALGADASKQHSVFAAAGSPKNMGAWQDAFLQDDYLPPWPQSAADAAGVTPSFPYTSPMQQQQQAGGSDAKQEAVDAGGTRSASGQLAPTAASSREFTGASRNSSRVRWADDVRLSDAENVVSASNADPNSSILSVGATAAAVAAMASTLSRLSRPYPGRGSTSGSNMPLQQQNSLVGPVSSGKLRPSATSASGLPSGAGVAAHRLSSTGANTRSSSLVNPSEGELGTLNSGPFRRLQTILMVGGEQGAPGPGSKEGSAAVPMSPLQPGARVQWEARMRRTHSGAGSPGAGGALRPPGGAAAVYTAAAATLSLAQQTNETLAHRHSTPRSQVGLARGPTKEISKQSDELSAGSSHALPTMSSPGSPMAHPATSQQQQQQQQGRSLAGSRAVQSVKVTSGHQATAYNAFPTSSESLQPSSYTHVMQSMWAAGNAAGTDEGIDITDKTVDMARYPISSVTGQHSNSGIRTLALYSALTVVPPTQSSGPPTGAATGRPQSSGSAASAAPATDAPGSGYVGEDAAGADSQATTGTAAATPHLVPWTPPGAAQQQQLAVAPIRTAGPKSSGSKDPGSGTTAGPTSGGHPSVAPSPRTRTRSYALYAEQAIATAAAQMQAAADAAGGAWYMGGGRDGMTGPGAGTSSTPRTAAGPPPAAVAAAAAARRGVTSLKQQDNMQRPGPGAQRVFMGVSRSVTSHALQVQSPGGLESPKLGTPAGPGAARASRAEGQQGPAAGLASAGDSGSQQGTSRSALHKLVEVPASGGHPPSIPAASPAQQQHSQAFSKSDSQPLPLPRPSPYNSKAVRKSADEGVSSTTSIPAQLASARSSAGRIHTDDAAMLMIMPARGSVNSSATRQGSPAAQSPSNASPTNTPGSSGYNAPILGGVSARARLGLSAAQHQQLRTASDQSSSSTIRRGADMTASAAGTEPSLQGQGTGAAASGTFFLPMSGSPAGTAPVVPPGAAAAPHASSAFVRGLEKLREAATSRLQPLSIPSPDAGAMAALFPSLSSANTSSANATTPSVASPFSPVGAPAAGGGQEQRLSRLAGGAQQRPVQHGLSGFVTGGGSRVGQFPPALRHSPRSTPFSQEGSLFVPPLRHQGSTPDLDVPDYQQQDQSTQNLVTGAVSQRTSPATQASAFAAQRSRTQVMLLPTAPTPAGNSSSAALGSLHQLLQQAAAAAPSAGVPSLGNWQVAQVLASSQVQPHSLSHAGSPSPSFTMPHPLQHQPVTPLMGNAWQGSPLMMQRNASSLALPSAVDGTAEKAGTSPSGGGAASPFPLSTAAAAGMPAGVGAVSSSFSYTPASSHVLTSSVIMTLAAAVQGDAGGLLGHRHQAPGATSTAAAPGGKRRSRGTGSPQQPASGTLTAAGSGTGGAGSAPRSPVNLGHSTRQAGSHGKLAASGTEQGPDPGSAQDAP